MKILFSLDREEKIDPNDALGDIIISSDDGEISVRSTYLDSWFSALIEGYDSLQKNQNIKIDIIEEPESITFERLFNKFKISYGKQHITFKKIEDFYQCLSITIKDFMQQFEQENIKLSSYPLFTEICHFQNHFKIKELI
ncbi:hypothetical protein ACN4EE_00660 [Geminocystis sp. CENA526]|uniref:hypothetical protein n=1 Tax=Geminocystis sp. CENA526 TaxID=1355871 RepID=UPI003D6F5881